MTKVLRSFVVLIVFLNVFDGFLFQGRRQKKQSKFLLRVSCLVVGCFCWVVCCFCICFCGGRCSWLPAMCFLLFVLVFLWGR